MLQIKPEVANPLPLSFVFSICFTAFLENTIPIIPKTKPIKGINNDKTPTVKEITELLFVWLFSDTYYLSLLINNSMYLFIHRCYFPDILNNLALIRNKDASSCPTIAPVNLISVYLVFI